MVTLTSAGWTNHNYVLGELTDLKAESIECQFGDEPEETLLHVTTLLQGIAARSTREGRREHVR